EFPGKITRLGQQEQAYLGYVCSGRDVNQVVFALSVEFVCSGKIMQRAVDLLEVPRIAEVDLSDPGAGFRRACRNIAGHLFGDAEELSFIKELQPVDQ